MTAEPARILVVAPAWVGDMVMAQSLVARLVALHPGAAVDLVAPPFTAPLGARMPGVARTFVLETGHGRLDLTARAALARQLRAERHELAIVLPGSWKSALVPFLAGIPRRRGYLAELRYWLLTEPRRLDKAKLPRTVDRFVALAGEEDLAAPPVAPPVLRADPARARQLAAGFAIASDRPVVALCPGAEYGPAKQWPSERFAALAAGLVRSGCQVMLIGAPKDRAACAEIATRAGVLPAGALVDLAGRTSLLDAVDLLGLASAAVSNDSGLMHVAAALDRPLVAIYGSSSPAMTPPLGRTVRIAEIALSCRPCFQRTCPLGHLACLTGIDAEHVAQLLAEVAPSPSAASARDG